MTDLIYQQLLELYIFDLEVELLAEKLKNINIGVPQIPVQYPWQPQRPPEFWPHDPYRYDPPGPPWIVTCGSQTQ